MFLPLFKDKIVRKKKQGKAVKNLLTNKKYNKQVELAVS